jgi:DNA-binding MarR family transcriptional regulator
MCLQLCHEMERCHLIDQKGGASPQLVPDGPERESSTALELRIEELTQSIGDLTNGVRALVGEYAEPLPNRGTRQSRASFVRELIRQRRMREKYFDAGLFGEPAWDMMLDLYCAHLEGKDVSVSSLCMASAVPVTTALRWITSMTESGLFERRADPTDGRRIFVALSPTTLSRIEQHVAELRRLT